MQRRLTAQRAIDAIDIAQESLVPEDQEMDYMDLSQASYPSEAVDEDEDEIGSDEPISLGLDAMDIMLTEDSKLDPLDLEYKNLVLGRNLEPPDFESAGKSPEKTHTDYEGAAFKKGIYVRKNPPQPTPTSPPTPTDDLGRIMAHGSRKEAHCVIWMTRGTGTVMINGRDFTDYFLNLRDRLDALKALILTECLDRYDIKAKVQGGGFSGQKGAFALAVARGLAKFEPSVKRFLRKNSLLLRDFRRVERKKYGLTKARRAPQWRKR